MGDRPQEVDTIAHTKRRRDSLQPLLFALVPVTDVLAQHDQAQVVVVTVSQQGKRLDGDVNALQSLEPADEQEQPPRSVADLPPSLGAIERLEGGQVDA